MKSRRLFGAINTSKPAPRQANSQSPLLSVPQVARRLGVHPATVIRLIAGGNLPAMRLLGIKRTHFRIRPEMVEDLIAAGEREVQKETER